MARVEISALDEVERLRAQRLAARRPRFGAARSVPTELYLGLMAAGFGLIAVIPSPVALVVGGALVAFGAYRLGTLAAAGIRAERNEQRADGLTNVVAELALRDYESAGRAEPAAGRTTAQSFRPVAGLSGDRRPDLRAIDPASSADPLDRALSGEGADGEGALG